MSQAPQSFVALAIALGSGIHNNELPAQRVRRRLQVCDVELDTRKARVRNRAGKPEGTRR
jgi:hypothetical protein